MSLTKDDIAQIRDVVVDVATPMFEHVIETLGGRIDGVESRLDGVESRLGGVEFRLGNVESRLDGVESRLGGLESEFRSFKAETRSKFSALEERLEDQTLTIQERLGHMEHDITFLYKLVDKMEHGTPAEKKFAKLTIEKQVPVMYRSLQAIAKKAGVELPQN